MPTRRRDTYAISQMNELQREASALSRNQRFMAYLDACQAEGDEKGSISLEEIRRKHLPGADQ